MTKSLYFSGKSIGLSTRQGRSAVSLLVAARHNLREIQAELGSRKSIDPARTAQNIVLHGPSTARGVAELAQALKDKHLLPSKKLRRDHVQALEFMVSIHRDADCVAHEYFGASLQWFRDNFPVEMILSAVIHLDEGAPHMHVLVLPIVAGKYQGGAPLKYASLMGLTHKFAAEVGKRFGLSFAKKPSMSSAQRVSAAKTVLAYLHKRCDPSLASPIWPAVCDDINRCPISYAELLGINWTPASHRRKYKTFTQIMTGVGRRTTEDREVRRHA